MVNHEKLSARACTRQNDGCQSEEKDQEMPVDVLKMTERELETHVEYTLRERMIEFYSDITKFINMLQRWSGTIIVGMVQKLLSILVR